MSLTALIPALLAGAMAIGVTVAVERLGGRLGGVLGTVPSAIVPAALGLYLSSPSDAAFQAAMYITPVGMLLNVGFLFLWREVPMRLPLERFGARLTAMTVLSLGAWLVGALGAVWLVGALRRSGLALWTVGWGTTALIAVAGVAACWRPRAAPRGQRKVGVGTLLMRGVLASSAVLAAIALAARGGDLAAGVAMVFPAIFLTTMVALWLAQGEAVPAGAVGPMMLGSTAVGAYAVLAAVLLPRFGPASGSGLAWLGATLGASVPAWMWLRRRREGDGAQLSGSSSSSSSSARKSASTASQRSTGS